MIHEMNSCIWDLDRGVLTTAKEAVSNSAQTALENAPWYKNAFADLLGLDIKKLAPPPEAIYNLDEDRSIKTIHNRNANRLTSVGSTPPRKKGSEIVDMASSDEDSASSSSMDQPRDAGVNEEEVSTALCEGVNNRRNVTDGR